MGLVVKDLFKKYGEKVVVDHIGFEMPKPGVYAMLGTNGAGKSTSIRMILGMLDKDGGEALWNGEPLTFDNCNIGYLAEERGLYPKYSLIDQIRYFGELRGVDRKTVDERLKYWAERLKVEEYIDGDLEVPVAFKDEIGRTVDYSEGRNRYIGYLISMSKYSFKDIKVGLDVANGAAWQIAKSVFDALGAKTYVMNNEPDGYNINTDCGSTHIEHLQKFVVEKGLDIGFAYDGDADRCLCVDEKGNVVTGDHILYIYGLYMKERGKLINNKVVTTIMSNFGLYKALDKVGIEYDKTKVGDKYVYENMVQTGNRIGGEQSGHIIFTKYATTGDGILTSIKMMEVFLAKEKPMSELAAPVVFYPQVLKNVRVKSKPDAQNDPDVQAAVAKVAEELGDTGRILVRESGTEPVIRVMVEAESDEVCEKYVDSVIDVIKAKGHIVEA